MKKKRVRVLFDPQIFMLQRRGGISRYFVELIKTFRDHPELAIDPVLTVDWVNNLHAVEDLGLRLLPGSASKSRRVLSFYSAASRRWDDYPHDLIHHTFYSRAFWKNDSVSVSTLYDMIPELFPKPGVNPHLSKKHFMKNSDYVLSISNTSLQDMGQIYNFSPKKSSISYLGVDELEGGESRRNLDWLPSPYLLFVGQRGGYKQGELALQALSLLRDTRINLLFVGSEPATLREIHQVNQLGLKGRVHFFEASAEELPSIYKNALALCFPSLKEGFGFPPLEAQQFGTRVIALDNPINREISGDRLIYFREPSPSALCQAIESLGSLGGEVVEPPSNKPRERFSWLECASKTANAYFEALTG